ncbi:uncharacterized protein [Apostichopus japonicus]|uniref:uncharacterized protein isoform X2 n=1 Tax=Stichopus japonicus TaxID=307972 RepID=UPI003AB5E6D3
MANAKCHFPENLSQFENEACFVGDLGMYKMVDITKTATDISFRFENPRNDPKKILIATEPSVPLLPPNEAYRPGYMMTLPDIFKKGAHLRTIDQFEHLCKSYPSLVFGPIADTSLFGDWNAYRRDSTDVFKKYDDVLYLGCSRDLIMNELHEEMEYKGTETHANHLYHGGCLSFMPAMTNTDKVAGILLYPSGAAMDILTVTTLASFIEGSRVRLSAKPENETHRVKLGGVIRQIESTTYPDCRRGYSIVRTDYQCHLVKINLCEDGDVTAVTIVESINTQHRPTSVAVSPFLPTEHICALDSGEVILSESSGRLLRSAEFPQDDRKINPIFSHFGAHPREAFIHDHHEALLYDFRSPKHTKNSIFELPSFCLPFGQAFCVARQHPTNHFYHYIATQDVLLLLDQRFPQHTVFQTCHNGRGMPSYLEVSSCKEAENMDIVMVGNHASKQVHCFFVENESKAVPRLFSLPWKVGRFEEWLEVVDGVKPSANPKLWERLSEPLLGLSACPVTAGDDVNSWNVLQISGAGDMFCQTFHSPAGDDHIPKQQSVDELSRKLCDLWIKSCCNEQDVKVQAPQQCRKRTSIEYHPPCERCQSKDCILGAKSNHGMKETVLRLKNRPANEDLIQSRQEELHKLFSPLMCESCAGINARSITLTGGNNVKWNGFVKSLKLPWQDDVEISETFKKQKRRKYHYKSRAEVFDFDSLDEPPTADSVRTEVSSPVKQKPPTNHMSTPRAVVSQMSGIEIQSDYYNSSLIMTEEVAEIPLSQQSSLESSFLQNNVEDKEVLESSFSKLLESKKQKVNARRKRSGLPPTIGF